MLGRALLVVCAVAVSGCSIHPPLDTPYDPCVSCGESLMDQIPNNEIEWNADGSVRGTCYPRQSC